MLIRLNTVICSLKFNQPVTFAPDASAGIWLWPIFNSTSKAVLNFSLLTFSLKYVFV